MSSATFFIVIFILYLFIYAFSYIHRPKVYSKSSKVNAFASMIIFPMFLMPYGVMHSIIQLCRKVNAPKNTIKKSLVIEVDNEEKVLLDVYESLEHTKKFRKRKIFYFPPLDQFVMLFFFSKFISKGLLRLILNFIRKNGGNKMLGCILSLKVFKCKCIQPYTSTTMKHVFFNIKKKLLKSKQIAKNTNHNQINREQTTDTSFSNETTTKHESPQSKSKKHCETQSTTISTSQTSHNFIQDNVLLIHGLNGTSNST